VWAKFTRARLPVVCYISSLH